MRNTQAVVAATGLLAIWTLATYLLEARLGTFLRPDAMTSRFVYTVVVNVLIGTIGAGLLIRALIRRSELPRVTTYGIVSPLRILVLVPVAAVLAGLFLRGPLPASDPVILANASAQVLVVSIAEVVVCWCLFGSVLRNVFGAGFASTGKAVVFAALAFGIYHFAHSPPFNTPAIVVLLSGVGARPGSSFFSAATCTAPLFCTTHSPFAA
jgi:hypothetical protein